MAIGSPVGISETPRRKDDSSPCLYSPGWVSISLSLSTHCHQGVADLEDHRGGTTALSLHMVYGEEGEPADPSTRAL